MDHAPTKIKLSDRAEVIVEKILSVWRERSRDQDWSLSLQHDILLYTLRSSFAHRSLSEQTVLAAMSDSIPASAAELLARINIQASLINSGVSIVSTEYFVLMPISIDDSGLTDIPYCFKFNGRVFGLQRLASIADYLGLAANDFVAMGDAARQIADATLWLSCSLYGRNRNEALSTIGTTLEALRGVSECVLNFGNKLVGPNHSQLGSIPRPKGMISMDEFGELRTDALFPAGPPEASYFAQPLDNNGLSDIQKAVAVFSHPLEEDSIQAVIFNGLRAFSYGMEDHVPSRQFIAFWQALEQLTLAADRSGDTKHVSSIIAYVMSHSQGIERDIADACCRHIAKTRNELIHGVQSWGVDGEDVHIIRQTCELLIQRLIMWRSSVPTRGVLSEVYSLLNAPLRRLDNLALAIKHVLVERDGT